MTLTRDNLRTINSLTKYPSIPTYHALGEKGRLTPDAGAVSGTILLTEKIDGTNARMIFLPNGRCLIGSRENLLWADGDLIGDPAQGIVEALREIAERINQERGEGTAFVLFGELFGGKITGNSKQYTGTGAVGFRLFDVLNDLGALCERFASRPAEEIVAWRESGGQPFLSEARLLNAAERFGLDCVPLIGKVPAADFPTAIEATAELLRRHSEKTLVALDEQGLGRPEGLVIRAEDRSFIYKIRHEDYARTLRK